jgi:beta-xylosidase
VTLSRTVPTVVLLTLLLALLLAIGVVADPALAGGKHRHRFHSGAVYRGAFPDPDVFRVKRLWIATSTTVAGRSLPMLTSHDGRKWRARRAHGVGARRTNDALVGGPRWAVRRWAGRHRFVPSWAPSIGRAGHGRWLVAYAAPLRRHPGRRCVGIARSKHPDGPFRHSRRRPLVCARGQNAIDPDLFRSHGRTYLLWKTEGIRGRVPATLWSRPLRHDGRGFKPGSRAHRLLRPGPGWEGPVVENPSMVRFHGRLYLFYSANRWYTRHYAVGYAVCRSVTGPCHRVQRRPLLASGRRVLGPGGQSAFRGPHGRLLLAYAAWPARRVGSERRLHIATLKARRHGRLVVTHRFRRA